ncbi:hypothetical protein O9992_26795 [Vibrio lentus]|nr:hypothetical protein [Vibrio lentus]
MYSSQMASVVSEPATQVSETEEQGETPVKLIDSNVISAGDLSILGLEKMKQIVIWKRVATLLAKWSRRVIRIMGVK